MNHELRSSLLIVFACFLWALDLLVRYPLSLKLSYVSIVFFESLFGLLFVSPWIVKNFRELKSLSSREWFIVLFIGGIGMSVAGYLQTAAIQKATPGLFSFFQIFQPLFVIYLAHIFLKERVDNLYVYWGVWIILSAVLMFSVDLELMFSSEIILSDMLIAFSTMIIWGLCTILGKEFLKKNSPFTLVTLRWIFAFIFSSGILLFERERLPLNLILETDTLGRFTFIGIVAGVFSMFLYYSGLKKLPVGKVSFIEISYGAFGLVFSAVYTFESLNFFQFLGAASFFSFLILFLSRQDSRSSSVRAY